MSDDQIPKRVMSRHIVGNGKRPLWGWKLASGNAELRQMEVRDNGGSNNGL